MAKIENFKTDSPQTLIISSHDVSPRHTKYLIPVEI